MNTVYAVFRAGVFRNDCGGVFFTLELAASAAVSLRDGEPDSYHRYEVVPFVLDETTSRRPGRCWGDLDEPNSVLDVEPKRTQGGTP